MIQGLTLKGTALVFGGPYSNLQATQAMRQEAKRLGIAPDHVICTGDVIAYCADAKATYDVIREWDCHVVMGNCEESLGNEELDCGCGFEEGTACDLLSKQWFDHANAQMSAEARLWMRDLPRTLSLKIGQMTAQVIHGSPDSINEFVFASQSDVIDHYLKGSDHDMIIGGHCGVPFYHQVGAKAWLNAGVIGMPANDGTARVWYALLDPQPDGDVLISLHVLTYDFAQTQDAMTQAHLAEGYKAGLESGLWPSLDVLPAVEKAQTGVALEPWVRRWHVS